MPNVSAPTAKTPTRGDVRNKVTAFINSVRIREFDSAVEVAAAGRFVSADEVPTDEYLIAIDGGVVIKADWDGYVRHLSAFGGIGYALTGGREGPRVCIWYAPTASLQQRAFVLGHELGHMAARALPYHASEEMRSDAFGIVAARVVSELASGGA